MKKLYMVALGQTLDREASIKKLMSLPGYGPWFYSMPSTFCIYSHDRAGEIFRHLHDPSDVGENLFITEVPLSNAVGWLPKAHCDLIAQNSIVHSYVLDFQGYWAEGRQASMPDTSGIYCVYACIKQPRSMLNVSRLLYIGKAENIRMRLQNHEKHFEWRQMLVGDETLCYSYAELPAPSLSICEAAMIFQHKPPCNEQSKLGFYRSSTHVTTSGANLFLSPGFTVYRTTEDKPST